MKKVLVVEDETSIREALRKKLVDSGYEVNESENGSAGLKSVEDDPPDVILLDILMPVMDGKEMMKTLKKHPKHKDIPIIILTNLDPGDETLFEMSKDPPSYYIVKSDIKLDEVIEKVKDLIGE